MSRLEANIMNLNNIKGTDERIYQASVLADISISLAQIADALNPKTELQEISEQPTAQWVHSDPHKVKCSKCGCQVSMKAAYNMKYCFECGAKMVSSEKTQEV